MIDDSEGTAPATAVVPKGPKDFPVALEVPSFVISIHTDAGEERIDSKGQQRVRIGSDAGNEVVVNHPAVSGMHCAIDVNHDGACLTDLESTNGTVVDGVRVTGAWLKDGATIHVGPVPIRFRWSNASVTVPLYQDERFGSLVGRSARMRRVFEMLHRFAATDVTVLVQGETGTGKEGAAEAIHAHSPRAKRAFIVVDCGAIPANLLESELFGHRRGSFTGATQDRTGAFEAADGGTLFLDEIGELSLDLQPKLLRALEEGTIRRIGDTDRKRVDVRVVAATHRPLHASVNSGRFRADLYYRLAVLSVEIPPLRTRSEDVPILVKSLLAQIGATEEQRELVLDPSVIARLKAKSWPGNARELRNYIERLLVLGDGEPDEEYQTIRAPDASLNTGFSWAHARKLAVDDFERRFLHKLLEAHKGNVSASARAAGMDRVYLYRLMRRHGLR